MNTDYITILPNKNYPNLETEKTDNLRCRDVVQYGYIKLRDLDRWLNNEVISVKMGMLTPSEKSYCGLTILQAALKRIDEQDTTALFEDEDELIPVYVFVATITDNEWRENLISKGYVSSRTNKSREGIKINKKSLFAEYGFYFGIETEECKSIKEQRHIEFQKQEEKRRERTNNIIKNYNKINGKNAFEENYAELREKSAIVHINPEKNAMLTEAFVDVYKTNEENTAGIILLPIFYATYIGVCFATSFLLSGVLCALTTIIFIFVFVSMFKNTGYYSNELKQIYPVRQQFKEKVDLDNDNGWYLICGDADNGFFIFETEWREINKETKAEETIKSITKKSLTFAEYYRTFEKLKGLGISNSRITDMLAKYKIT